LESYFLNLPELSGIFAKNQRHLAYNRRPVREARARQAAL
jgi:hypothetical protein